MSSSEDVPGIYKNARFKKLRFILWAMGNWWSSRQEEDRPTLKLVGTAVQTDFGPRQRGGSREDWGHHNIEAQDQG